MFWSYCSESPVVGAPQDWVRQVFLCTTGIRDWSIFWQKHKSTSVLKGNIGTSLTNGVVLGVICLIVFDFVSTSRPCQGGCQEELGTNTFFQEKEGHCLLCTCLQFDHCEDDEISLHDANWGLERGGPLMGNLVYKRWLT